MQLLFLKCALKEAQAEFKDPRVGIIKPLTEAGEAEKMDTEQIPPPATEKIPDPATKQIPPPATEQIPTPIPQSVPRANILEVQEALKSMSIEELHKLQEVVSTTLKSRMSDAVAQTRPDQTVVQSAEGCSSSTAASAAEESSQPLMTCPPPLMLVTQTGAPEIIGPAQSNCQTVMLTNTSSGMMTIPIAVLLHAQQGLQAQLLQQPTLNPPQDTGSSSMANIIRQWLTPR